MPLDDLLRLVETLRARIDAHGDLLVQNETRTRYALIDPLLRALGWDVEDPTQVVPEYSLAANRADYALLRADGKPAIIVEAKRLNRPLADGLDQSIAYCVAHGTPYFCVTDGRLWALYETFRQVAIDQKLVTRFGMTDSPADVCLKAMALWRPGVLEGQVRPAEPPVVANMEGIPESVVFPTTFDSREADTGWISLAELQPASGDKPTGIKFPNNRQLKVTSWISLMVELVTDLSTEGHLTLSHAPFKHKTRYILTTSPTPPDGKTFMRARQAGPFHVETNYSGPQMVERARAIVEHARLDPAQFRVRLRD